MSVRDKEDSDPRLHLSKAGAIVSGTCIGGALGAAWIAICSLWGSLRPIRSQEQA